ncbi:hypothetical protein H5410_015716 [Solanum commersonii]|uniref:Uncharacterized protein n=1 Tax=Solanum commersonii TaxID=4109 RepID=A0A9J5ZV87_SOLCO|nr:hypothetical protein H5410_015716 [Solanum commersonii]
MEETKNGQGSRRGGQLVESTLHIQQVENDFISTCCLILSKGVIPSKSSKLLMEWATGIELRHLFVIIVMHYQVSDSHIISMQRKRLRLKDLKLNEEKIEAYSLFEIENILQKMSKSLKDIEGLLFLDSTLMLNEELNYDKDELKNIHDKSFALLNSYQLSIYEAMISSIDNEKGKLFFIHDMMDCSFTLSYSSRHLKDILRGRYENNSNKPSKRLTVVCGSNFRQILCQLFKKKHDLTLLMH